MTPVFIVVAGTAGEAVNYALYTYRERINDTKYDSFYTVTVAGPFPRDEMMMTIKDEQVICPAYYTDEWPDSVWEVTVG